MDILNKEIGIQDVIGEVLRQLRKAAGLSQEDLVRYSGVSKNYLSEIERGLKLPSYITLRKLAYGLNLPLWQLVCQIEQRAEQLGELPNAKTRKPGREPSPKALKGTKDWQAEFVDIRQQGRARAMDNLLDLLEDNKNLLKDLSAEDLLNAIQTNKNQEK